LSEATNIIAWIVLAWIVSFGLSLKKPREGLMVTALLATLVSLYLGNQHFVDGPSTCDVGDLFSCSAVNKSEYSEIAGLPIAFLGAGYYAGLLFIAFFADAEDYEAVPPLLKVGGVFSVLLSIVLAYISKVEVGAWCLFCISLYGFNVIGLIGAILLGRGKEKTGLFYGKAFGNATTVFVVTVVVSMALFSGDSTTSSEKEAVSTIEEITESIKESISFDGSEPRLGSSSAPYQLVEFADFECPHCAMIAPELKKLVVGNSKVSLRFKQYPLSNLCNPNVSQLAHENACTAAAATECAHKQDKFWEMNRLVFKNQKYLSKRDIDFLAEQIGLDMTAFGNCMIDPVIMAGIKSDINAAEKAGVTGTPSIFLTGIGEEGKWYRLVGNVDDLVKILSSSPE